MSETKIFSLDRAEGELAVCVSDDDEQIVVPKNTLGGLEVHDVFSARIDGDRLVDIVPMPEERDSRLNANRSRLHALARRTKNKS
ncbi:MAG: hypothetical protein ACI3X1_00775 [Eubacteriales bacterium]